MRMLTLAYACYQIAYVYQIHMLTLANISFKAEFTFCMK